jgi:predicted metal-dependent hydrolase
MTDSRLIRIENIGDVLFERSRRTRRILITIRPGRGIRVAVPGHVPFKSAVEFVRGKKPWIKRHLEKIREYEKQKKAFNDIFQSIDKWEARKQIIGRLNALARRYGFTFNKVSIRDQRTRWGSCSARGNISLNIKLVALPRDLSDYVLLHELVHTRIHNHSQGFWRELDKYVGDGKAMARRLVEYGLRIL